MVDLIGRALDMGWPVLMILFGLLIYFQATIKDPERKKRATFQTMIGILCMFLVFVAVSNYAYNFAYNDGMLPVSLLMITIMSFIGGLYFTNVSALMRIGGFMFLVAAILSGYGELAASSGGWFSSSCCKVGFCQHVFSAIK